VLGILRIVVTSDRSFTLAHCVALRFGIAFLGRSSERSAVRIVKVLDTDPRPRGKLGYVL
jgi:DNA-binding transcriptional LysR family regulator